MKGLVLCLAKLKNGLRWDVSTEARERIVNVQLWAVH